MTKKKTTAVPTSGTASSDTKPVKAVASDQLAVGTGPNTVFTEVDSPPPRKNPVVKKKSPAVPPTSDIPLPTSDKTSVIGQPASDSPISNYVNPHPGITIVIPFIASKSAGSELLYAVRAWEKNLPGARIVIIGDSLPWFGKDLIHIPHKPQSTNPQIDVATKMATAIASDLVPEAFIWSNDDIYPVSEIETSDIEVKKAMGYLGLKGAPATIYWENSERTLRELKDALIAKPYDYATHTPMVFEKSKLAVTLSRFGCQKEGYLISSLYYNTHFPDIRPLIIQNDDRGSFVASVWSSNPSQDILKKVFEERKFINNNDKGWPHVEPFLKKLFPDKSAFEK